jgi:hypothetical protein
MSTPSRTPSLLASLLARVQGLAASVHGRHDRSSTLAAVQRAAGMKADLEAVLAALVTDARDAGATWQEVGDVMSISRQAAYQRFGQVIDPRTGRPLEKDVTSGSVERATTVFDLLSTGRPDEVHTLFDDEMKKAMGPTQLGDVWSHILGSVGAFESSGTPTARRSGDFTVVDVPLHFEAGDMVGRVSCHPDGRLAGLFLLDPAASS